MKQSFTLTSNFFSTSNSKVQNIIGENLDSDVFDCLLVSFAFTVQILKMKTYNYKYKCINAQIQKIESQIKLKLMILKMNYKENEVWCNGRGGASTDINLSSILKTHKYKSKYMNAEIQKLNYKYS